MTVAKENRPDPDIDALIQKLRYMPDYKDRITFLARHFIGTPYCEHPLGGGPGYPETLTDRLDCFDCVTFIESVIALASAGNPNDFRKSLSRIRYNGRSPSWEHRLHYISQWLKSQERRGLLRIVHPKQNNVTVRKLDVIPGIPPVNEKISFHRWHVPTDITRGIIAFVSTRNTLDVFHLGFYFNGILIHASRSAGSVIAEPLSDFLSRETGTGLLLARL